MKTIRLIATSEHDERPVSIPAPDAPEEPQSRRVAREKAIEMLGDRYCLARPVARLDDPQRNAHVHETFRRIINGYCK